MEIIARGVRRASDLVFGSPEEPPHGPEIDVIIDNPVGFKRSRPSREGARTQTKRQKHESTPRQRRASRIYTYRLASGSEAQLTDLAGKGETSVLAEAVDTFYHKLHTASDEEDSDTSDSEKQPADGGPPSSMPTSRPNSPELRRNPITSPRLITRTGMPPSATQDSAQGSEELNYPKIDAQIQKEIEDLVREIERCAHQYFKEQSRVSPSRRQAEFRKMCINAPDEFATIVGRIAAGGPNADDGWKQLFFEAEEREALVCGIIGNALVEQVFAHMLFGATKEQRETVENVQREFPYRDGFVRTKKYAEKIHELIPEGRSPPNFNEHVIEITGSLHALLSPILPFVGFRSSELASQVQELIEALYVIVEHAGRISLSIRRQGDAVYYWVPTLKDDRYEEKTMRCFNYETMVKKHPRAEPLTTHPSEEDKRRRGDEGLIRINCMNGLTVYRKGGFKKKDAGKGIRSRVLLKNSVACRWGRQRKWVNGEPADKEALHGSANWKAPGFMEFRDVVAHYKG